MAMFLFDLQTVAFLVLNKARSIAEIETFKKAILPRPPRSFFSPTYAL